MNPFLTLAALSLLSTEPYRASLVSVQQNSNPESFEIASARITPDCPTTWSVRKLRLHGGKQEGVDLLVVDNGKMKLLLVPSRGMGIWAVTAGDIRLGWDSPVHEIVHPSMVNLAARGGLGWLDGFGEFLCRCGLENNGHPGPDVIVDNTGAESTVDLTLHGRQAYLPAQEVTLAVTRDPPYEIRLHARVEERMMHGPKLELTTELVTTVGSNRFRILDEVANKSTQPSEFQILYHTNLGSPLLEEGSRFHAPLARVVPFNARAVEGDIHDFAEYLGPTPGYAEQVYCLYPLADKDGATEVLLADKAEQHGLAISYSTKQLPYLTLWKNTAAREDGYVTGIEPGTNFPYNRGLERKAGRVPKLDAGQSRRFELEFAVLQTAGEVREAIARIESISGGRKIEFASTPEIPGEEKP